MHDCSHNWKFVNCEVKLIHLQNFLVLFFKINSKKTLFSRFNVFLFFSVLDDFALSGCFQHELCSANDPLHNFSWLNNRTQRVFIDCINLEIGNFLMVQWLGLCSSTAWGMVPSLVGELRSHIPWGKIIIINTRTLTYHLCELPEKPTPLPTIKSPGSQTAISSHIPGS